MEENMDLFGFKKRKQEKIEKRRKEEEEKLRNIKQIMKQAN